MKKTAAKDRKRLRLAAVLALSMALLLPGVGEASRTLPPAFGAKVAPPITAAELLNFGRPDAPDAPRFTLIDAENCLSFAALSVVGSADTACFSAPSHFRLFDLPSPIDRLVELELGPKTAYRRFFGPTKRIYRQTRGLRLDLHQGVYFLQPDPLGPVDSPNLYQGFGFDALNVRDPMGLNVVDPERTLDPKHEHYRFEGDIYRIFPTGVVHRQVPESFLMPAHYELTTDKDTIEVIAAMAGQTTVEKRFAGAVVKRVAENTEGVDDAIKLYWTAAASPLLGELGTVQYISGALGAINGGVSAHVNHADRGDSLWAMTAGFISSAGMSLLSPSSQPFGLFSAGFGGNGASDVLVKGRFDLLHSTVSGVWSATGWVLAGTPAEGEAIIKVVLASSLQQGSIQWCWPDPLQEDEKTRRQRREAEDLSSFTFVADLPSGDHAATRSGQ